MSAEFIEIYHALKESKPLVLATIINSRGSTPRTSGSRMIIYDDGGISGTIGGGAIEGDVIERAMTVFDTKRSSIASYDLRQDGRSDDLDLICGGHMEVILEYVDTCPENVFLYGAAYKKIEDEQPFLWKAVIKEMDSGILLERCIQNIRETSGGKYLNLSLHKSGDGQILIEPVLPTQTAYIIGGGHVSKEITKLTKHIGMKTLVFDDRRAFASESRFPEADGINVCPDYVNIFEPFKITENSYIIIVTRGHSYDKVVLSQALKTRAGYIGMMGSRKKRDILYEALITEGCNAKELERVHCPIGLPIKEETPAELAVSIVAELIEHRASSAIHD